MGYTTDFEGEFKIVNGPMKPEHVAYLKAFSETRRMLRDSDKASKLNDPIRIAAKLPIGTNGAYFVGGEGFAGQDRDDSVLDYNRPSETQPGLWCQWIPTEDGTHIIWDGNEKFYNYIEWIEYIIKNFLKPWGYTLHGVVKWYGEDRSDMGAIGIIDNEVLVASGKVAYELSDENLAKIRKQKKANRLN